jgi:serine/tyrosine/threonine adenylyltransferase
LNPAFAFDNTYAASLPGFYVRAQPRSNPQPRLVRLNRPLARQLGLDPDALSEQQWADIFSGNSVPEGADPIALAYAGHQFGNFVPQLGDGRAILLGEISTGDARVDIQLKGSGRTAFSRGGDGRAALGPVLREYLVSETMHALGIPTTRALAAVTTGDEVVRDRILPGAVLTRVAASHIRIGTFQFFAARRDNEAVRRLADYALARHYPDADSAAPYRALLDGVIARQAELVARWVLVGFIHGVMNTDNMSVSGETIDYGPCAFMDAYDPATVFSSIDQGGRYAYGRQPAIAQWNLARLAECLLPLLADSEAAASEIANASLAKFPDLFGQHYLGGLRRKIGLATLQDGDEALCGSLLDCMATQRADFTQVFRTLSSAESDPVSEAGLRALFADSTCLDAWLPRWRARLAQEPGDAASRAAGMRAVNPAVVPRNHLVEGMIAAAVEREDFQPFEEMLGVLATPFADPPAPLAHYAAPPETVDPAYRTFCGT